MEYIDRIFYRKINPSDFKKLYDIDKPESGGGQTYLEAAGITYDDLVDFLGYAEISKSTLKGETRSVYTMNAYVLGNPKNECAFIEFAPRGNRNNYRISRQNMKYKHPAWSVENGFPEPLRDRSGEYTSDGNFDGIIDNLVIYILRTTNRKYYAGFLNMSQMPFEWPTGIGLESMFTDERRGVLDLEVFKVQFINAIDNPFGNYEYQVIEVDRIKSGSNILLYGVPGCGKSYTVQNKYCKNADGVERVVFHPDYTYGDFVGQILPVTTPDNTIEYVFTPGPFTRIMHLAYRNPEKKYCLVVEEINRGNAPAIFGDIFQLLDRNKDGESSYSISNTDIAQIVYGEDRKVSIPTNLSILATMNTSDQNVFTLDTAFQRRWNMRMIENNVKKHPAIANIKILDTSVTWGNFNVAVNEMILMKNVGMTSSEDKRLGVYFVSEQDLEYMDPTAEGLTEDEIEEANDHNHNFPEKVIKYLWDDAFKFTRAEVFKEEYMSLEQLIDAFETASGDAKFGIFVDEIFNLNN